MYRRKPFLSLGVLGLVIGCNFNAPFDPANLVSPIDNALDDLQNAFDDVVSDPFGSRPFPALIGGDNERVYYATNLGDSRINFPGPTSDIVVPGFAGPSNLYQFASKQRELIRPLVPGGSFLGLTTDGRYVAFVSADEAGLQLVASAVDSLAIEVIFDSKTYETLFLVPNQLKLDDGRLAFAIIDAEDGYHLRVEDLTEIDPAIEIELESLGGFDLQANRLAYVGELEGGSIDLLLRDLSTDETITVVPGLRVESVHDIQIDLTDNRLIWSEPTFEGTSQVFAYNLVDGTTELWVDGVIGDFAGGNDEHFVTQELVERYPQAANLIKVRRYDADGTVRVLAEFRADGLAGQTTVIGDRAAWVNPEREVVLAPLAGGDRTIFKPF